MTNPVSNHREPDGNDSVAPSTMPERQIRPIGAWVVAGFLLFATLTMWTVVSIVFCAYS
jgi:hypothetical protein